MTTDPMRIVAMSPTRFGDDSVIGGGERYPENIARAVAVAGGDDVEVMLMGLGPRAMTAQLADGVRQVVVPIDLPAPHLQDALAWGMEEPLRGASVVHVHQAFTRFGQLAVLLAGLHGVPIVLSDHGGPTLLARGQAELRSVADAIVSLSIFGSDMIGGATAVVAGGVDADWFCPSANPQPRTGFAYVGRILPHKRIERAIDALPPDAPLVVCGRTADPTYLKELRRLAKGKPVKFVLDADDNAVRDVYRSAKALVMLSEHVDRYGTFYRAPELMGLSVLEAMACGTPAVVAATGALPEYVTDGKTGFVVSDDEHLAQALLEIHTDHTPAEELGGAARDHLVGRWDLPTVGEQMLAVYRGAISAYRTGISR